MRDVWLTLIFAVLFLPVAGAAQPAAPAPAAPPPPPLWERSAELSLVATGGNTDTRTLGAGAGVTWRPGLWITEGRLAFVQSETDDVKTAESFVAELRQARKLSARLEAFARGGYLSNDFAGIDHRTTLDGGLGYMLVDSAAHRLRVDGGLGYSNERRTDGTSLSFPLANFGAGYKWKISAAAELSNAALFTASLDDGDDWRFGNGFALTAAMTRVLSIKLSHELRHLNAPVPGFEKTDTLMAAALVAKF